MRMTQLFGTLLVGAVGFGCEGSPPERTTVGSVARALTEEDARVLGFEAAGDWSSGAALSQSTTRTQGDYSLAVGANGWAEVVSRPLGALGEVGDSLSVDLRLPHAVGWGDVHVILKLPSQSVWWADLGGAALSGLTPSVFHDLSFPLSPSLRQALSASYTDLEVRVIYNGPALSGPFLFDNMSFTAGSTLPGEFAVSFPLPVGVERWQVALAAAGQLDLRSNTLVEGTAFSVNGANGATTVGAGSRTASVVSLAPVQLQDGSTVDGDVTSRFGVDRLGDTTVTGDVFEGVPLESREFGWRVTWPETSRGPVDIMSDAAPPLSPGRNDAVLVKPGATLRVSSGQYYFDSVIVDDGGKLSVDAANGPVEMFVGDGFIFRGNVESTSTEEPDLLVVDFGGSTVFLEHAFRGSVVAPGAKLVLRGAAEAHVGAFFGKDIELGPNAAVRHHPLPTLAALTPLVHCVRPLGNGVYEAVFGYDNQSPKRVDIPRGDDNEFSPDPEGRGQPEVFLPHRIEAAFATRFNEQSLTWHLGGKTATATPASPACSDMSCSDCGGARSCVAGECVSVCGDGLCSQTESCSVCPVDCGCPMGQVCRTGGGCATPARCGIEWECGSGTSFGVDVDCGDCPNNKTCVSHACLENGEAP